MLVSGPGSVQLSSGANTYSGGTTVNGGGIIISAASNLGSGTVGLNGGALTTTAGITDTNPFTVGASGGTINVATTGSAGSGQYYFHTANTLLGSGPLTVTGTGALMTTGAGNLRVDATNSYGGNITLQSGGVFPNMAALASAAVSASATFNIGNQGELAVQGSGSVTLPNSITISGGTNSVLSFENGTAGVFTGSIAKT